VTTNGNPLAGEGPKEADELAVNGHDVLERLIALPISTWHYRTDPAGIRHLGPMAQDFAAAFGLGSSDKLIDMLDANGVVMVAIQALFRRVVALEAQLTATHDPGQPDQSGQAKDVARPKTADT
jgi:hypothetical protein